MGNTLDNSDPNGRSAMSRIAPIDPGLASGHPRPRGESSLTMQVAELWRYPVKSLRGEQLGETELRADGIPGDRLVHVRAPSGRVVTSRTRPRLLGLAGTLGPGCEPLIDGRPWSDPASRRAVEGAAGAGA